MRRALVDFQRTQIPTKRPVKSLYWRGDALVDAVAGNIEYRLDGTATSPNINWAYRFDAAVQSPSGHYVVIYEKLGTKGLLVLDGKLLRELNRSFYQAHAYEFPVAFCALSNGQELLIHCPEAYNQIDIEDAETGARLTGAGRRKSADFFHSRFAVSKDGRWLLSAGWVWHPVDSVCFFDIGAAIEDPTVLDDPTFPNLEACCEMNSAAFLGNDRLLLASAPESEDFREEDHADFTPGHLGVFRLNDNRFERVIKMDDVVGTMMPVGADHVVAFYQHPRLINWHTGEVVASWPDINTGKQNSSILWHHDAPPPVMALDPVRSRFAVAEKDQITVIELRS